MADRARILPLTRWVRVGDVEAATGLSRRAAYEHLRALRRGEAPPGATAPSFAEGVTTPAPSAPAESEAPAMKLTAPRTRNPRDLPN